MQNWGDKLVAAFKRRDAQSIAKLIDWVFSKDTKHVPFRSALSDSADKLFGAFFEVVKGLQSWKEEQCSAEGEYKAFSKLIEIMGEVQSLISLIKKEDQIWILAPVQNILKRTKMLFRRAKSSGLNQGKSMDNYLEKVFAIIRSLAGRFNRMKEPEPVDACVKAAIEPLIQNMAISLYLATHDYTSCLKKLEEKGKVNPDAFPSEDRSIYFYNQGRVKLVGCRPIQSEACFEKVECVPEKHKFVLRYLVPCKLLLGQFASLDILIQLQLGQYIGVSQAVRQGNLQLFDQEIKRYQSLWIRRGLYLLMDKIRTICLRNLVRKVHLLLGCPERVELELLRKALNFSQGGEEYDLEEAGCLIGNLAYLGLMKGYIYHSETKHLLVLRKDSPFPPVRSALKINDTMFV